MYRSIDTEIWNDGWFQEELSRDQKLLFLFLITNQRTTTAGAFEITLSSLSTETGIPRDELAELLPTLAPKVVWWPEHRIVWVRNFHRRQFPNANEKIVTNARGVLSRMPADVRDTVCAEYPFLSDPSGTTAIPHPYPTDRVSIPLPIEEGSRDTDTADSRDIETGQVERVTALPPAAVMDTVESLLLAPWINDEPAAVERAVCRAFKLVPDFNTRDGPVEAEKFVRRNAAKPPSDWYRTWLNWIKNAVKYESERQSSRPAMNGRAPATTQIGRDAVDEVGAMIRRQTG